MSRQKGNTIFTVRSDLAAAIRTEHTGGNDRGIREPDQHRGRHSLGAIAASIISQSTNPQIQ